ncbi:hypothetical protein ACIBF6_20960 [Streptosporangium amethystogenes]|uniref:hypothetical protein n=1 Tax=Streptosporangium amethystogenes TaxID=2002 RepID=UPI0037888405
MMEAMSPGTGPLSPDFAGIDPELMQGFITALEHGRDVISEQTERIRQLLATAEVSAVGLLPIREIDGWVSDELLGLRKRLQTINQDLPMLGVKVALPKQSSAWSDDLFQNPFQWGLLPYDEKTGKSPAGSAKKGTELAFQLSRLPPSTLGLPDAAYDRILGKLADGQQDAYLTAGFFRVIGPQGMLGMLGRLDRYDKKAADGHRKVIGDALATAVGAQPALLGSEWQASNLKKAPDGELASLLRYGMFPAAWLTEIARGRVGKPVGDGDGTRPRRWQTDLVPLLPALANNPDVARGLFNAMSREDLRDLFTELNRMESPEHAFQRPPGMDFDISTEFGRMLAAGGGAYEKGPHSPEAAKFAFNVMTVMGDLKDTDGTEDTPATPMEVAPEARIFMSTLAGAYATEITEGANIGDANMTEASALKPFTSAFGTTAAFTLSPKDTYDFLKTFADSARNLAPFDQGMGRFSQQLIADASATARRTGDVEHLDRAFTALGNVRGFELAAVEKVQGDLDMVDEQRKNLVNFTRDTAIALTSIFAAPTLAYDFAWFALSTTLAADGAFGDEDETRMDKANKDDRAATLSRQHTYAQLLMANGFAPKVTPAEFQASCPPGVSIIDAKGDLRPFAELAKQGNKGLESFERWAAANGMGGDGKFLLGELSSRTANRFEGGNKRARERALAFDS